MEAKPNITCARDECTAPDCYAPAEAADGDAWFCMHHYLSYEPEEVDPAEAVRADRLSAVYLEGFADGYRQGEEAQAAKEAAMWEGAARARQM